MLTTGTALCLALLAEIPLPDHTIYGTITTENGQPIVAGARTAQIHRDGQLVLSVEGGFAEDQGVTYYVIHVPLETAIDAPGPVGVAAREGDVVAALLLNNEALELGSVPPPLAAAAVNRIDATSSGGGGGLVFFRGDCSPDRTINITDPVALLGFLFLGGPPPAAPGPQCGVDESPSALGCAISSCVQ
jgi:hypothetical protein